MKQCIIEYEKLMPNSPISGRLRSKIERNEEQIREFEVWLETVPDAFVRDAIKAYQRCGSWSAACLKMYGYPSYQTVRKAVERYIEKEERFR